MDDEVFISDLENGIWTRKYLGSHEMNKDDEMSLIASRKVISMLFYDLDLL